MSMRGLSTPNAVILGNSGSGSAGGADLSDIDFTAVVLDSRVDFNCASVRAYYAADATIQFAGPDVWPVEYRDGVAVGRHEPEPQATNWMNSANPENLTVLAQLGGAVTKTPVDSLNGLPTIATHLSTPNAALNVYALLGVPNGQPAPNAPGVMSVYISVDSAQPFTCYSNNDTHFDTPHTLQPGPQRFIYRDGGEMKYVMMGLRNVAADYTALMAGFQFEAGVFATSPILANGTPTTRAAAFASVTNPGRAASGIQIWYTDGDVTTLDFNGAGSVDIPVSEHDWGTRYIERITYIKAAMDPLSDIDMLSPVLDSRISYVHPGKLSYYAASGAIEQAGDNVWPLEWRDGVAVGRHEPEPQAVNYVLHGAVISPDEQGGNATIIDGPVIDGIQLYDLKMDTSVGTQRYIQLNTQLPPVADSQFTTSFYAAAGGSATHSGLITSRVVVYGNVAPYLDRRSSLNLASGVATEYPGQEPYIDSARADGGAELWRSIMTLTAQSPVTRVGPRIMLTQSNAATETDMSALVGMMQVEFGQYATSPIPTTNGAVTRAEAFASVRIFNGATGLKITYNDGTDTTITFTGDEDGYFQLPQSSRDWGTRYITRISYIRSE